MADVIQLNERLQRNSRKSPVAQTPGNNGAHDMAVVLLFTGIRYERIEQTALTVTTDPAPHSRTH